MAIIHKFEDTRFTREEYERHLLGEEIWKVVEDYEGLYEVSSFGTVKSLKRMSPNGGRMVLLQERVLMPDFCKGYLRVTLTKEQVHKKFLLHRLVAFTFLLNHENKPEVNHENGVKGNCRVDNLNWATRSENSQHAFDNNLKEGYWKGKKGEDHNTAKKVNQYDLEGNFIKLHFGFREAERNTGIPFYNIAHATKSKRGITGGSKWRLAVD